LYLSKTLIFFIILCISTATLTLPAIEHRFIKKIEVPKTCPVTEITLHMVWIDGCVRGILDYLKIQGITPSVEYVLGTVDFCHEREKDKKLWKDE